MSAAEPALEAATADRLDTAAGQRSAGTKAARQRIVVDLVRTHEVRSQTELAELLAVEGFAVTQATLSRDLVELGAVKVRAGTARPGLVYAIPGEGGDRSPVAGVTREQLDARLARLCEELLVTAEASANLVVLRTPPGGAQFLASAIDGSVVPDVLGTIAGDDSVLVVTRAPDGGRAVAERFLALAAGGSDRPDSQASNDTRTRDQTRRRTP